jgi:DNA-binding NarL/FixJ family response regulator
MSCMKRLRVALADDHRLLRDGLRAVLQGLDDIDVVGEAADGREALALVKMHQPDILLMDIGMKGMNGLEAAARVATEYPRVRVIILSMHDHEEYVWRALQAGVAGYLLKDSGATEVRQAILAVSCGEKYLTPAVSKHVIDNYVQRVGGDSRSFENLTPRHREVLQLIAEGSTTKEMARILHLSAKTVETHRSQLMERLKIHDIAGLVRYAMRHRVIDIQN